MKSPKSNVISLGKKRPLVPRPTSHAGDDSAPSSPGTSDYLHRFEQALQIPSSMQSLREVAGSLCSELGFDGFFIQARMSRFVSGEVEIYFGNTQVDWRDLCRQFGLNAANDPLVKGLINQSSPLVWQDAKRSHGALFARACEAGMANGISHLMRGRGGAWTIASFVLNAAHAASHKKIAALAPVTHLLTSRLHDAIDRICSNGIAYRELEGTALPRAGAISLRERECLSLAMAGNTAQEIAELLAIAPLTATQHLKDARQKLGAKNIVQAIAIGIATGVLSAHTGNPL